MERFGNTKAYLHIVVVGLIWPIPFKSYTWMPKFTVIRSMSLILVIAKAYTPFVGNVTALQKSDIVVMDN